MTRFASVIIPMSTRDPSTVMPILIFVPSIICFGDGISTVFTVATSNAGAWPHAAAMNIAAKMIDLRTCTSLLRFPIMIRGSSKKLATPQILSAMRTVEGSTLAPESIRMMEYLRARSEEMTASAIRERIRAAARELESAVDSVSPDHCRLRPIEGKWTIAEVVDHISQTQIRGTEELRHLLAGRRPPLPPVYEALRSGAGQWAPWESLTEELRAANQAMLDLLSSAPEQVAPHGPTVKTVMVTLRALPS